MKFWKILAASFAALALFTGCTDDEDDETIPTLEISESTMTFEAAGGSSTFTVTSNRDWTITSDDWLSASPSSGTASDSPVTVTVTALPNTSTDRTGSVKVATSFDYKTLTVTQSGESGSAEASVVYKNDFDKEEATKTYGSGESWPYLDEFEGWKNEEGTGIASVSYTYSGMSVRANSASNGTYSNYEGSGVNNLFFGKNAYIKVKEITLSSAVNYTLSFGTEKYVYGQDDNTFNPEEFHVYISNDTTKWVELTYAFPGEYQNGKWDIASTTFTVPSGTSKLSIYIGSDIASSHRLDDLTLVESSEAGTEIDFSTGTEIDNGSGSEGTPSGSGTLDDPYNPAKAAEVASALESGATTDSNVYIKGKISSIKYEFSANYGTATFNISEDGTTTSLEFTCYSVYYLENKPWVEGNTQIKVGDEVIIYGKLTNYKGDTPETASKQAYIYSLNGNTENEVGDTEYTEKTISEMIDAAEDSIYVQTQEEVLVAAITKRGYVAYDGTKAIYVYQNGTPSVSIGDKVTFTGQVVSYYGMPEIINPTTTTVSNGNTVNYPEPNDITSSFDSYTQTYAEYISFTATIVKNGNYTNFQVEGASTYVGSLSQPLDTVYNTLTEGKKVKIYGFYNGRNTSSNLQQVILVKYEILDDGTGGGETTEMTISEMNAAADEAEVKSKEVYVGAVTTKGYVATDGTQSIYVYMNSTPEVAVGDKVTFTGKKTTYGELPEIADPTTTKVSSGNTVTYPEVKDITSTFDSYTADYAEYVTYTATVVKNGNYTNFSVEGASRQGSFSQAPSSVYSDLTEGAKVQITGFYNGLVTSSTPNRLNVIVKEVEVIENGGGGDTSNEYTSNIEWTVGSSAETQTVRIIKTDGDSVDVSCLKLGTSKKAGTATITVPQGTTKITFYGYSWKDKPATLSVKMGDTEVTTLALDANDAISGGTKLYRMQESELTLQTLDISALFGMAVPQDTQVTLTTTGENTRVVLFALQAYVTGTVDGDAGDWGSGGLDPVD